MTTTPARQVRTLPGKRASAANTGASWLTLAMLALVAASGLAWPGTARAQTCWITGSPSITFGEVTGSGGSTSGTLNFRCTNYTNAPLTHRVCLYMNPSNPTGLAPRRMQVYFPLSFLEYDLYADPAGSQILGSESSGHPVYSAVLTMAQNGQADGSMQVYARIPAGQGAAAGGYVGQMTTILRHANRAGTTPPTAAQCSVGPASSNYTEARASFSNTCHVSLATDMDFGAVSSLGVQRDQTSAISLRCPTGTAWQMALNYGSHASGTVRRMAGPDGGRIRYELYTDPARTRVWGNTPATGVSGTGNDIVQTRPVYGRVPVQPVGAAGTYSDTITITLTY